MARNIAFHKVNEMDFPCIGGYNAPPFGGIKYFECVEKTKKKEIERMKKLPIEEVFARYERIIR